MLQSLKGCQLYADNWQQTLLARYEQIKPLVGSREHSLQQCQKVCRGPVCCAALQVRFLMHRIVSQRNPRREAHLSCQLLDSSPLCCVGCLGHRRDTCALRETTLDLQSDLPKNTARSDMRCTATATGIDSGR